MKTWALLALGCVAVVALALLYEFGTSSVGAANAAGILVVFVGVIAAGVILRRTRPP